MTEELFRAHEHSSKHKPEILASRECGCFYCKRTYPPSLIEEWITERDGRETAVCPFCGIDSVIGSASGCPITPEFLEAMRLAWF